MNWWEKAPIITSFSNQTFLVWCIFAISSRVPNEKWKKSEPRIRLIHSCWTGFQSVKYVPSPLDLKFCLPPLFDTNKNILKLKLFWGCLGVIGVLKRYQGNPLKLEDINSDKNVANFFINYQIQLSYYTLRFLKTFWV